MHIESEITTSAPCWTRFWPLCGQLHQTTMQCYAAICVVGATFGEQAQQMRNFGPATARVHICCMAAVVARVS
jgi:hypothetical protein